MSADEARQYHSAQVNALAASDADLVTATTMNYPDEAIGVVLAARDAGIPAAVSYTVETDGRLPNGDTLADAVERADEATDGYASYFLINCAHPTHFDTVLQADQPWTTRLRGLRSNGSSMSHAELDVAEELHSDQPDELAALILALRDVNPQLTILGGCCGTHVGHIEALAAGCRA